MGENAVLATQDITKSFGGIKALKGVHFSLLKGEVHALLGENGAGKSTFIKILSGAHAPDTGIITVDGRDVGMYTPHQAKQLGIATIYQETSLFPDLSVTENLFSGQLKKKKGMLDWAGMTKEAERIFTILGVNIPVSARLSSLGKASAQLVEIAKALIYDAKILIMDEPTAALSAADTQRLFSIIRNLKKNGTSIIYISHHLEEILEIGDRATILRDGTVAGTGNVSEIDEKWIIRNMIGKDLSQEKLRQYRDPGKALIKVKNLSSGIVFQDINLEVREGEVVGIAGLVGAGKTELLRAIFGIDQRDSGEIFFEGNLLASNTYRNIQKGIGLIPEDRSKEGLLLGLSASLNLSMTIFREIARLGIIDKKKEQQISERMFDLLRIRPAQMVNMAATNFSGGNQQKLVLGKWLAGKPKVLLLDDPTQGVDVNAKFEIHKIIDKVVNEGLGVLLVSSDFQELVDLSDRILVMKAGRIISELPKGCGISDVIEKVSGRVEGVA